MYIYIYIYMCVYVSFYCPFIFYLQSSYFLSFMTFPTPRKAPCPQLPPQFEPRNGSTCEPETETGRPVPVRPSHVVRRRRKPSFSCLKLTHQGVYKSVSRICIWVNQHQNYGQRWFMLAKCAYCLPWHRYECDKTNEIEIHDMTRNMMVMFLKPEYWQLWLIMIIKTIQQVHQIKRKYEKITRRGKTHHFHFSFPLKTDIKTQLQKSLGTKRVPTGWAPRGPLCPPTRSPTCWRSTHPWSRHGHIVESPKERKDPKVGLVGEDWF